MKFFRNRKRDSLPEYHPPKIPRFDVPLDSRSVAGIFADCDDFEMRPVFLGGRPKAAATLCYIDGVVSGSDLSETVLRPLSDPARFGRSRSDSEIIELMMSGGIYSYSANSVNTTDETVKMLVNGFCAIIFDSVQTAVCFEVKTDDRRTTEIPEIEKSVRGAKDAFVETIRSNTSLTRRKLRNPMLKVWQTTVGRQANTNAAVLYIEGLTSPELVKETKKRLKELDIDGVISSANLEEYVCDDPYSPLPQIMTTERSDKFAMNLLEGRVGVFIDGLPFGYIVPGTLPQFLKVPEDNSIHWLAASALTYLRYFALFLALFLPAFYVAIAVYHQEMIPTKLMLSIIESKQDVPFSTVVEVFGIMIAFELLQEAGLRLPNPVGETVSIIGALIVGQSAVEAKVISPIVIIIVATAGIAGYTLPSQELSLAVRMGRFLNVIAASLLGMFGIAVMITLTVYHACSLESFGVGYTEPLTGADDDPLLAVARPPLFKKKFRDRTLSPLNLRNQK